MSVEGASRANGQMNGMDGPHKCPSTFLILKYETSKSQKNYPEVFKNFRKFFMGLLLGLKLRLGEPYF